MTSHSDCPCRPMILWQMVPLKPGAEPPPIVTELKVVQNRYADLDPAVRRRVEVRVSVLHHLELGNDGRRLDARLKRHHLPENHRAARTVRMGGHTKGQWAVSKEVTS